MQAVKIIGLDIAKSIFQVHGVDADGQVAIRRQLKRRYVLAFFQKVPSCLVCIEACATSHHWSRELQALGHTVRLMPPAYVKPYVKRQKNDATDAEAICEAVTIANMRFVATKTPEQQSGLVLHRTRHLFIRQQTAVINAIRAHLAEFGMVAPVGRNGLEQLLNVVANASYTRLPEVARACLMALGSQLRTLKAQLLELDRLSTAWHQSNETSKRLDAIRALVMCWLRHWLPAVPTRKCFGQGETSRPGLDWGRSSIRVEAGTASAVSVSKVTAICVACSRQARLLSFAMPRSMAPSIGLGSRRYWRVGPRRSPPSRLPTRSRGWPGP